MKSDFETIVVEYVDSEKNFVLNPELIKCHYNDLSYTEFIEFMSSEYISVGLDPEQYDVVDAMNELGIFEKCPECDAMSEGTTYLWEVNKTIHQCQNGHMWEGE